MLSACRKKQAPAPPPPPPRPSDVQIEIVARDPSASWDRLRATLGVASLALPNRPFTLFGDALGVSPRVGESIEPIAPFVAIACAPGDGSKWAFAWKLRAPERFLAVDPPPRKPSRVVDGFLVGGSDDRVLTDHAPYLVRALALALPVADVRIEIDGGRGAMPIVSRALDDLDRVSRALAALPSDAPPEFARSADALSDLARFSRTWSTTDDGAQVDVSIDADSLHIVVTLENKASRRFDVSGSTLRFLSRLGAQSMLGGALPSPF